MKKIIAFILSLALLTGCVKTGNNVEEGKLNVVTSFFPAYDLVSRVGGEHVNVTNLTETGDAHTYEPSIKDMEAITKADLLVVNGAGFEPWIENIKTNNPDLKILELSEGIELMEGNHDHDHEHDNAETHDHNHDHHHEKITEKDVDDRQLIEFKGKWHSITEFIEDGTLNPLVEFVSLENKQEIKDAKSGLLNDFKTDYSEMEIKDNSIEIDGKEFKYSYDGFIFEDGHHHPHVWYKFKLLDETKDAPKYIVINDHGFKANQEKDPNHVDHIHLA
ncbi:MAG: zinc ABC transporter substrate-binding protein, partial [Tissierellia bacterium]|nr:zinc ABC transporter substrate-binding protein [Tissierellia bacterium]